MNAGGAANCGLTPMSDSSMNANPPISDAEIAHALIHQVAQAVPPGGSERDVATVISHPMWCAFLRYCSNPETSCPTEWYGPGKTYRVYGSETFIVSCDRMASVSYPIAP